MITIEEKLNIFSKLVFEKEQNESDKKLEKIQQKNKEIIEFHHKNIEKKQKEIIDRTIKEAERKKKEILSKTNLEVKKKILKKKRQFLKELENNIEERAKKFVGTNKYEEYLTNLLARALSEHGHKDSIVIYLTKHDIERFEGRIKTLITKLGLEEHKVELSNSQDDIIGGFILVNKDHGIRIDSTFNTIIEDNRDLMGEAVYSALEKAGDYNE